MYSHYGLLPFWDSVINNMVINKMTFDHIYLDNVSLSQIKTDPFLWRSVGPLQNLTLQNGLL